MVKNVDFIIKLSIKIMIIILSLILIYSVAELVLITLKTFVFKSEVFTNFSQPYNRKNLILSSVQGLIAAVLMITIIIEVIYSLLEYLKKGENNYIKVIIEIALIAIVRHVMAIDIEHINPDILVGVSVMIFVLGLLYLITHNKINFRKAILTSKKISDK